MKVHVSAGPRLMNLPLKLAVAGGSRASISPYAPIHHLIRTLGRAAQAWRLPKRRKKPRAPSQLNISEMFSLFTNLSNPAFFSSFPFFFFFFFIKPQSVQFPKTIWSFVGRKKNLNVSEADSGTVVYYHGNPEPLQTGNKCQIFM